VWGEKDVTGSGLCPMFMLNVLVYLSESKLVT